MIDNISVWFKPFVRSENKQTNKPKAYYSHPLETYFTKQETKDLAYIAKLGFRVVNPRDFESADIFDYVDVVSKCDVVFYRGSSCGVVLEVLSAIAFGKSVYSLETKRKISKQEKNRLVQLFFSSGYASSDLDRFSRRYPSYFEKLLAVLGVENGQVKAETY